MLVFSLIFICGIFYTTVAIEIKPSKPKTYGKEISRSVDTMLQLDDENSEGLKVINKAHKPIGKFKTVMEKKKMLRNQFSSDLDKRAMFTDFVQKVVKKLTKLNDKDLKYFVTVLSDEITKYHYKGCKFYELTENYKFRKFFARKLDEIKNMTAVELKNNLKTIGAKIEKEQYNLNERELVDLINSIYSPDSNAQFQNVLIKINDYKNSTKVNLVKIVNEGLRMIIFDHYTRLNDSARFNLKSKVIDFFNPSLKLNEISKVKPERKKYSVRANKFDHYNNYKLQNETMQKIIVKHFMPINIHKRTIKNKGMKLTFKTLYPEFVPEWSGHNVQLIKKGYPQMTNTNWTLRRRGNEISNDVKTARPTKTFTGIEARTTFPALKVNNTSKTHNVISPTRSSPSFSFKTRNTHQKTHLDSVEERKQKEIKQLIAPVHPIRFKNDANEKHFNNFTTIKDDLKSSKKTKLIDKNESVKVKSKLNENGKHALNSNENVNVTKNIHWKPIDITVNNEKNKTKIKLSSENNILKSSESIKTKTTYVATTEKKITIMGVSTKITDSFTITTNGTER